ncbi:Amidase signature enzyme [Mycena kentingensis (nom. inval.)]|nr:Amidase signature enzyme [Mycena kentingensis (nom. inval.)]
MKRFWPCSVCLPITVASGWSARGGQTTNPYYPGADPCGSSSGSAVAAAIGLAAVTLGTETDGSIMCPSSKNNVVGIKPTVGWTSRTGVIPIAAHQDSVGPITRSLTDAAIVLSIIASRDPSDNYTLAQPDVVPDFTKALNKNALKGKRIGVPRHVFLNATLSGYDSSILVVYEQALQTMRELGATVVDPADLPSADEFVTNRKERLVLDVEFKAQVNQWFDSLIENPSGVRSLADLIKFNDANPELEEPVGFSDQNIFIEAEASNGFDADYFEALAVDHDLGSTRGIDFVFNELNLDALVLPAGGLTPSIAAVVGYPIVTVPLGFFPDDVTIKQVGPQTVWPAPGAPFGLAFFGTAWSDFELISYAYAFEQKTHTRLARKAFPAAIPKTQLKDVIGK